MLKRVIMLIMLELILSSCGVARIYVEMIKEYKQRSEFTKIIEKDYTRDSIRVSGKYNTKEVKLAMSDVDKRIINKRENFGNTIFLIPENTKINNENGLLVDLKSGYELPIRFIKEKYCSDSLYGKGYVKKVKGEYYRLGFREDSSLLKKIIKANDFKDTCEQKSNN